MKIIKYEQSYSQKQFVSYDVALKLKELGFNLECMGVYECSLTEQIDEETMTTEGAFGWQKDELSFKKGFFINNYNGIDYSNINWVLVGAPLWQEALDWFRDKHRYHIDVTFKEVKGKKIEGINSVYFDIEIYQLMGGDAWKVYKFQDISDDYYYAREQAILKAIELLSTRMRLQEVCK